MGIADGSAKGSSKASEISGSKSDGVRPDDQLVVVRAVAVGHQARRSALVEAALLEADRERLHALGPFQRRKRGQERRVDAAGKEDADGHVGDEVRPHGVAKPLAELLGELGLAFAARVAGSTGRGRAYRSTRTPSSPCSYVRTQPGGSLAASRKMVSGAGTNVNARNASSASRSSVAREPRLPQQRLELRGEGQSRLP